MSGTRSDAVLEGAAHVLRGVSSTDHHRDGQAEVLRHGPGSDHVDGVDHLPDRNGREAQVFTSSAKTWQVLLYAYGGLIL